MSYFSLILPQTPQLPSLLIVFFDVPCLLSILGNLSLFSIRFSLNSKAGPFSLSLNFNSSISLWRSLMIFLYSLMCKATSFLFVMALVFMFLALFAYLRVLIVSSNWLLDGLTLTIMTVLQFPPSESFSSLVSFESWNKINDYSVRYKKAFFIFITKSIDTICKGQEGSIDFGSFHESDTSIFSDRSSFRPCQINERQFSEKSLNFGIFCFWNFVDIDLKNGMTSGRCLIGIGRFSGTSSVAHKKQIHDLFGGLSFKLGDPSNYNTFLRIISEIKVTRGGNKEVPDHLIVNFDLCDENIILIVFILINTMENISDGEYTE